MIGEYTEQQLLAIATISKKALASGYGTSEKWGGWFSNTKAQRIRLFKAIYKWEKSKDELENYYGATVLYSTKIKETK